MWHSGVLSTACSWGIDEELNHHDSGAKTFTDLRNGYTKLIDAIMAIPRAIEALMALARPQLCPILCKTARSDPASYEKRSNRHQQNFRTVSNGLHSERGQGKVQAR